MVKQRRQTKRGWQMEGIQNHIQHLEVYVYVYVRVRVCYILNKVMPVGLTVLLHKNHTLTRTPVEA